MANARNETTQTVAPTCPRCGIRQQGFPTGEECGECGHILGVPTVSDGVVIADRDCVRCGAGLEGREISEGCPGCGLEGELAIDGDLLVHSSSAFVRRLLIGSSALLMAMVLFCIWIVCVAILPISRLDPESWAGLIVEADAVVAGLLGLAGWWMLSTPDPSSACGDRGFRLRRILRVALLVSLVTMLATSLVIPLLGGWITEEVGEEAAGSPRADIIRQSVGLTLLLSLAAWAVKTVISLRYIKAIALRMPSASLAVRANRLVRFTVIGAVLLAAFVVELTLVSKLGLTRSTHRFLFFSLATAAVLVVLMWCGTYASLIGGLRARLTRVARVQSTSTS